MDIQERLIPTILLNQVGPQENHQFLLGIHVMAVRPWSPVVVLPKLVKSRRDNGSLRQRIGIKSLKPGFLWCAHVITYIVRLCTCDEEYAVGVYRLYTALPCNLKRVTIKLVS